MIQMLFFGNLNFYFVIQLTIIFHQCYGRYDSYVAFYCDHPSMVYRNGKWIDDPAQSCTDKASDIVSYCQKSFPGRNITTAEPAIEKVKFTKWCDFNGENCDLNIEIRPFKCLDANFQSDPLTLPKDCIFGHLGMQGDCKLYKEWIVDARNHCLKQPDWSIRSYGMLFQCGKSGNNISPMLFRGVEFVCCPNDGVRDLSDYNKYTMNAVLESEQSEDSIYESTLEKLIESEKESRTNVINDFIQGEEDLKKSWTSDPQLAAIRETNLISEFRRSLSSIINQYASNKKKLLYVHNDRLKRIFDAKFEATMNQLERILKNKMDEAKITEVMKKMLDLLMFYKNNILEERFTYEDMDSERLKYLNKELSSIAANITRVFNKLEQVPQFKESIKQKLVTYLLHKFPSDHIKNTHKKVNMSKNIFNIEEIISKYKHKPESNSEKKNDEYSVHYDLRLNEKDKFNHYAKADGKHIFDHGSEKVNYIKKTALYVLVGGTLIVACLIILLGSVAILHRRKASMFKYSHGRLQEHQFQDNTNRFGSKSSLVENESTQSRPFNVYENPTYNIIQTTLTTSPDEAEFVAKEHLASPLIE